MPNHHRVQTVAVIGAGPSGSTLASLLAIRGIDVTLFDDGKRPELIVGESLIPAIIPVLRRLGIEERVAAVSQHKPGVSFTMTSTERVDFCFGNVSRCDLPPYAYNVPRPAFDRVLDERATELGVKRAKVRAKVERSGADGLKLSDETLAAAPWLNGKQPDLIVDASGRSRLFARTLDIPSKLGPRKDVAYFAHYEGCDLDEPDGQVVIGRLEAGWSWRIPLRDCLSIGVVMDKDDAAPLGTTPEERLEAAIDRDPVLSVAAAKRRRVTEVATYTNYQLISERGHGPGWVMAGDAYGFVDPMLSPGLWLALHSAELIDRHLDDLTRYVAEMERLIEAWMELISYFYDGRMFAMYHTGMNMEAKYPGKISDFMRRKMETHVACMASGATTVKRFSREVLKFMSNNMIWGASPDALAIK